MRDIKKPSIRYFLLFTLVKFYFRIYYRKFTIAGKENIPANLPVIFAANHQNALMDALAILFAANRPVVFLARADIFKKAIVARLLNFLKMLPVYRIRDGIDSMGQNQQVFGQTADILQSGIPLALLPEGTHSPIKRLQQLKKGVCRIAFMTAEASDFKIDLHIIPTGIDYTSYSKAGTHLLVNYGKPIAVADYYDLYRENPQKAIAKLRDDLAIAIKKLMIHVEDEANYQTIQSLTGILVSGYLKDKGLADNRINRFAASQEIIERIESASSEKRIDMSQIKIELSEYHSHIDRNKLKDKLLESAPPSYLNLIFSLLTSVLLFPVHVYGLITNYLPYKLPVMISAKMKDPQFRSSVNFVLSFLVFPLWYLLWFSVIIIFSVKLLPALLIALTWPVTGLFTFYNYIHLLKLGGKIRLYKLKRLQPEVFNQLLTTRQELAGILKKLSEP